MKTNELTNATVFSTDFAAAGRRAALARMHKTPVSRPRENVGAAMKGVWMSDVSGSDRRSVKAWLDGRGDGRVFWWNLRVTFGLAKEFNPDQTEAVNPVQARGRKWSVATLCAAALNRLDSLTMRRPYGV